MADQPAQTPVNPATARFDLRREKTAARQALPAAAHRQASILILGHLAELLRPLPPATLAFCWPIRAEVDCRPLVETLLKSGWQAAMPVVVRVAAPMAFHRWTPDMAMAVDPHGIPVPAVADPCAVEVVLLPLVAFDDAGFRLGYGGGYFDRTLAACPTRPRTIGVGFELGRVASITPQAHDMPLDAIVTEAGVCRPAGVDFY